MKLYKHKNHRDIAYQILKLFYIKEKDGYNINFRWWNVSGSEPFWMGLDDQKGFIDRVEFEQDWEVVWL